MIYQLIAAVGVANSKKQENNILVKSDLANYLKEKTAYFGFLKRE